MRVVIEGVDPEIDGGKFSVKRVLGEEICVRADIFADGHAKLDADLLFRHESDSEWQKIPMKPLGNDLWEASFICESLGFYEYTIKAWIDPFQSWRYDFLKKVDSGLDVSVDQKIGIQKVTDVHFVEKMKEAMKRDDLPYFLDLINSSELARIERGRVSQVTEYEKILKVECGPKRALFSAWYECFPRSFGGLKGCLKLLPRIKRLGFNVLYLPPIHPIGAMHRKGKNNGLAANDDDPGCPWAIQQHDAIDPALGTLEDFHELIREAKKLGIRVAMDLAFQCSPDHVYIERHPQWFLKRPDGTVQYAENPPKKYEDVVPFNFDTEDHEALFEECKRVVLFWLSQGVDVFRVDNPHTKPFVFWDWLIGEVKKVCREALFLSEAFTRPKVMQRLCKGGFDQSYTYFIWRNTKDEIQEYMEELSQSELREYFRPNFWPNTPDILPKFLQIGVPAAFHIRFVLAATLSSSYGIYGPAFEKMVTKALKGKEEYAESEKYEVKEWGSEGSEMDEVIAKVNRIREENDALHTPWNISFCETNNDHVIAYRKKDLLIVVSLDPLNEQKVSLEIDEKTFSHELLSGSKELWEKGEVSFVLDPNNFVAKIFRMEGVS